MKTITLLFKSLLSNQAAVDNRKMKWYFTLIVFLLAVFLPWIPFLSSGYRTDSSQVFKSGNYEGLERNGFYCQVIPGGTHGVHLSIDKEYEHYFVVLDDLFHDCFERR